MRTATALLVLAFGGCGDGPTGPPLETGPFFGHTPMLEAPPAYADWYGAVEACLGVQGDFAAVRWFLADSIMIPDNLIARRVGYWQPPDDITISRGMEHSETWLRIYMIKHVMQADPPDLLFDVNGRQRCW